MVDNKRISKLNFSGRDMFILCLIAACGLFSVWSYFNLDQRIFTLLSKTPVNWDDNFLAQAIAWLGKTWLPIWLLLVWFISTKKQQPVLVAFLAMIMVFVIVTPLKYSVKRPRPRDVINAAQTAEKQSDLTGVSFPSGDTASIFAVATAAAFFVSWRWTTLFLAASAAVALLRVTKMAHYPSDVFAGAGIGIFAGWLAMQLDGRWQRLKLPQFNLTRGLAIIAAIIIPLVACLSDGLDKLLFFLETYAPLALFVFLASKIINRRRFQSPSDSAGSI
ncbi:MAG: phosphatase PAP2 family protein [Phycisphaerae bacterium]|jgi:undecaprenyl-diphosphatase